MKTLTYEVILTNGVQAGKKLASEVVTTAPIAEVTANGTKSGTAMRSQLRWRLRTNRQ